MIPLLEYVEAANTSMTSIIIIYYTINFFILASNPSKVGTSQLQVPVIDDNTTVVSVTFFFNLIFRSVYLQIN